MESKKEIHATKNVSGQFKLAKLDAKTTKINPHIVLDDVKKRTIKRSEHPNALQDVHPNTNVTVQNFTRRKSRSPSPRNTPSPGPLEGSLEQTEMQEEMYYSLLSLVELEEKN